MTTAETNFLYFFLIFGVIELVSNIYHLTRGSNEKISQSARKQHQELPLGLDSKHYVAKAGVMMGFGIAFLGVALSILLTGRFQLWPAILVTGALSVYSVIQAFLYRSCWRAWTAIVIYSLPLVFLLLTPWNIGALSSHPRPVESYAEALQRIDALRAQEPPDMNPVCRLQQMTHEEKVAHAIVLLHGYTSCPQQFHELGRRFYDLGYNVLIAPMPHHGLADRMSDAHGQLTAEEMVAYADETVDIAQGLGEHITVMGFSCGGTIAAWTAQKRGDVDKAIIVSPGFGFKQIPTPLTTAAMNVLTILPDAFPWFDPVLQADAPPFHAYPRYSQHALAQIMRLGFATQAIAQHTPPATAKIVVVTNANDNSVSNERTMAVVKLWRAQGANLSTYEFDSVLKLDHDLIDPEHPKQQIELVYPRLIELVVENSVGTPESRPEVSIQLFKTLFFR